ncbi:hypothetical protein C8Q76DRAFT_698449 [Earliella scabrosa]|nr:hypothetical protein C8Q76DRAFT_698449 [Earliella scabrosa]
MNRYCELGAYVAALILLYPMSDVTCRYTAIASEVLALLPYVSWAWLRTHALTNGNKIFAAVAVVLNASSIAPGILLYATTPFVNEPYPYGCTQTTTFRGFNAPWINITCDDSVLTHIFYEVQWASRCAMLLGEILVLYWTLKRTQLKYTTFKFANISVPVAFGRTRTLADIMQENGIACFG